MRRLTILPLFFIAGLAAVSMLLCTAPLDAQSLTNTFGGLSESSDEPIDIRSDSLTVYTNEYALFTGNVKAVQGSTTLRARELKVHYVGSDKVSSADKQGAEQPTAGGAVKPSNVGTDQSEAQRAAGGEAEPPPTFRKGDGSVAPSAAKPAGAKSVSDRNTEPTIEDRIDIESDWLLVDDKEKYAHFKGNVRVERGATKLRSSEMKVNYSGGDRLMSTSETNTGPTAQITKIVAMGNVRALLTQKQPKGNATAKKPAATTPGAAVQASAPGHERPASGADAVAKRTATASGLDVASPSKEVAPAASNAMKATPSKEPPSDRNRQITKLEATGEVVITSADDETSTSDWAVYDLPSDLVTIGGNVVLTQKETVLKGDRLVVNLKTGESRFENTGTAATGGGRIRALFMPKQGNGKPDDAGRKKRTPSAPQSIDEDAASEAQKPGGTEPGDNEPLSLVPEFR